MTGSKKQHQDNNWPIRNVTPLSSCALKQTSETIVSFCKYLFKSIAFFSCSKISYPIQIWTFSLFEDFWSWGILILRISKPQILKLSTVFNALCIWHFNPCFVHFQFQILWQPFPCVRNLLNKKHLVFLVCFCCIASHQSPISHITSSRRRANISSWARALELGRKIWFPVNKCRGRGIVAREDLASIRMNEHFASPGIRCWNSWEISVHNLICHSFRWISVWQYLCNSDILKDSNFQLFQMFSFAYCKDGSQV